MADSLLLQSQIGPLATITIITTGSKRKLKKSQKQSLNLTTRNQTTFSVIFFLDARYHTFLFRFFRLPLKN
jgi:hypothetical protein